MNSETHQSEVAVGNDKSATTAAARSVISDFRRLLEIFDAQLERLPESEPEARSYLVEAKALAERGLKFSEELIRKLEP